MDNLSAALDRAATATDGPTRRQAQESLAEWEKANAEHFYTSLLELYADCVSVDGRIRYNPAAGVIKQHFKTP